MVKVVKRRLARFDRVVGLGVVMESILTRTGGENVYSVHLLYIYATPRDIIIFNMTSHCATCRPYQIRRGLIAGAGGFRRCSQGADKSPYWSN